MGVDFSKPDVPVAILILVASSPALFTQSLKYVEHRAAGISPAFAKTLPAVLKAYGPMFFVAGHLLACKNKQRKDVPDWCYIFATINLSLAGLAAHAGAKFPVGVLLNGAFLFVFGVINYGRAKASRASSLLAELAIGAGVSNSSLGSMLLAIDGGAMAAAQLPLAVPAHAQVTSTLFGLANVVRLIQLVQAGGPADHVLVGQFLKVVASTALFAGNGLLLGWGQVRIPGQRAWNAIAALALLSLARGSNRGR